MVSPATLLTRITQPTSHSPPDAHPTPPHDTYSQDMDSAVLFVSDRTQTPQRPSNAPVPHHPSSPLSPSSSLAPPSSFVICHLSFVICHLSFLVPRSSFLVPLFHSPPLSSPFDGHIFAASFEHGTVQEWDLRQPRECRLSFQVRSEKPLHRGESLIVNMTTSRMENMKPSCKKINDPSHTET